MNADLRQLRDTLEVLADRIQLYSAAIRKTGFSCCHNREDWITVNCSVCNITSHHRYLVEYAREAITSDSTSNILFSDVENCRSSWLNELKFARLSTYGSVDFLNKSWQTRHLIELSPCFREISRIVESPEYIDQQQAARLVEDFVVRRASELNFHHDEIECCTEKLGEKQNEIILQKFYAAKLTESLSSLGAKKINTVQMYGRCDVVVFDLGDDLNFVLLPLISSSSDSEKSPWLSGKVGMGFRLTKSNVLLSESYEKQGYIVLHLNALLPKEFIDYGQFSTREELCLNILARITACKTLLPDVLTVLRKK